MLPTIRSSQPATFCQKKTLWKRIESSQPCGGFKCFYFHPDPWGNDPIWLAHIVQMGWFNHHLGKRKKCQNVSDQKSLGFRALHQGFWILNTSHLVRWFQELLLFINPLKITLFRMLVSVIIKLGTSQRKIMVAWNGGLKIHVNQQNHKSTALATPNTRPVWKTRSHRNSWVNNHKWPPLVGL